MKKNKPFFPVMKSTRPSQQVGNEEGFVNENVGGLNIRDMCALNIFCAMAANPAITASGTTIAKLRSIAIEQADKFVEDLGEE